MRIRNTNRLTLALIGTLAAYMPALAEDARDGWEITAPSHSTTTIEHLPQLGQHQASQHQSNRADDTDLPASAESNQSLTDSTHQRWLIIPYAEDEHLLNKTILGVSFSREW